MSAWFRRRGATCDAIQYDGTNDEECAKLADCPVESIAKGVRVGQWLVMGHDAFLYQLDDDRFRERYEPVPLPEPAPVDGWEQWALVDRSKPKELQLIGFFDSEAEATIQISQFNMAGELIKVSVLPAPPVVEGGK